MKIECAVTQYHELLLISHDAVPIDDMPNNAQLDLRGHCTQVVYKLYYNVYMVGPELCRNASRRYPYNFELCMQLLCNALSSLVARYLAYHLLAVTNLESTMCHITPAQRNAIHMDPNVEVTRTTLFNHVFSLALYMSVSVQGSLAWFRRPAALKDSEGSDRPVPR